ncbi:MAG: lytic transglycosylase domain-containing protein [Spirochaetes bacterium]|nr:lytic transglycosylase domain-containing protein [Spirochaetota bacterium]
MNLEGMEKVLDRINQIHSKFFKPGVLAEKSKFDHDIEQAQTRLLEQNDLKTMMYRIKDYDKTIDEASKQYNIPANLIKSVIKQESNFNPRAVSSKGAKGLMQIMPETADLLGVKDVFNPEENINAGTRYLRMMLNRFDGDLEKSLAAYNAGPEAVEKYQGIPDYRETKTYIENILNDLKIF